MDKDLFGEKVSKIKGGKKKKKTQVFCACVCDWEFLVFVLFLGH